MIWSRLNHYWGTNFRVLTSLAHSQKYIPTQVHKLFWTHINIPHILPRGSHKYPLYKPHKLPWALSQKLPIISHILSKKYSSCCYQNWAAKLCYLHNKDQNHLTCEKNPKRPKPPLKPIATQQYFYKAQILIWHLFYKAQILFWHYSIKSKC